MHYGYRAKMCTIIIKDKVLVHNDTVDISVIGKLLIVLIFDNCINSC